MSSNRSTTGASRTKRRVSACHGARFDIVMRIESGIRLALSRRFLRNQSRLSGNALYAAKQSSKSVFVHKDEHAEIASGRLLDSNGNNIPSVSRRDSQNMSGCITTGASSVQESDTVLTLYATDSSSCTFGAKRIERASDLLRNVGVQKIQNLSLFTTAGGGTGFMRTVDLSLSQIGQHSKGNTISCVWAARSESQK